MTQKTHSKTIKKPYTKPALTYTEQIDLLIKRGLEVSDKALAEHYISHLNYYRLRSYFIPFEDDRQSHEFKTGTCFDDVLNLYIFDRELRLLMMDAIERVEVSFRTNLSYKLGHLNGAHAHLDASLFSNQPQYQGLITQLEKEVCRSKENFILHFRNEYTEPLPPIWALVEVMTIGQLSRFFGNLKSRTIKKTVADCYKLPLPVMTTFMYHISVIRNHCAHHARLWNRNFTVKLQLPRTGETRLVKSLNKEAVADRKIYNTLVMLSVTLDIISPDNGWRTRLVDLIEHHDVDIRVMGFPEDWQQLDLWK